MSTSLQAILRSATPEVKAWIKHLDAENRRLQKRCVALEAENHTCTNRIKALEKELKKGHVRVHIRRFAWEKQAQKTSASNS